MQLPVGISNFRKLIEYRSDDGSGYLFVDKSIFIKDIMNDGSDVVVITRPRRFGKTINMSMLHHFLESNVDGKPTKQLFDGLEISKHKDTIQRHQGKYPVIFVSFKDIKQPSYNACIDKTRFILSKLYKSYEKQLYSNRISKLERKYIDSIINEESSESSLEGALENLVNYLYTYYGKKPILLIDEYDAPIIESYGNGYFTNTIDFFRNLLSSALKDNPYLEKGVVTGILRISKESVFSALNNVEVYSIFHPKYSQYFGFTNDEVSNLFKQASLPRVEQAKEWYNGYIFGDNLVYNPWSIIKLIKEGGRLSPYWINTSGNNLIKEILIESDVEIQHKLQTLMLGGCIKEIIDEHIVFEELSTNQTSVWSLLLMSGYLKASNIQPEEQYLVCDLQIPNNEVLAFYKSTITGWLSQKHGISWYKSFLFNLTSANIDEFSYNLQELIDNSFSFNDTGKKNGEKFYHGLILGLVAGLRDDYNIKSNRESGKGLFDAMLIPYDKNSYGILFEFKVTDHEDQLESAANEALQQIDSKKELKQQGISNIIKIGISFAGKKIKVVSS